MNTIPILHLAEISGATCTEIQCIPLSYNKKENFFPTSFPLAFYSQKEAQTQGDEQSQACATVLLPSSSPRLALVQNKMIEIKMNPNDFWRS